GSDAAARGAPRAPRSAERTSPPPGEAYRLATLPPPPKSVAFLTGSGAPARRSTVEALVAGAVADHERAAVRTARRIGLRAERNRMPRRAVDAGREADRVARRITHLAAYLGR